MMATEPELGQILFGNPTGEYAAPEAGDALVEGILSEIERVFWNLRQREWDRYEDPTIPGVEFRPYYWGDDEAEAEKPNLAFGGVEIRWYKYPGRGSSCNRDLTPAEWFAWFHACIQAVVRGEA